MLSQLIKSRKEKFVQLKKVKKSFKVVSNPQTQLKKALDCWRRPPTELILWQITFQNLLQTLAFTKRKVERPLCLLKIEYLFLQAPNIRSAFRMKIVFLRKPRATKNLPLLATNSLHLSRESSSQWKGRLQDVDWQNWAAQICPRSPTNIYSRRSLKNLLLFGLNPTQRWLLRQRKTNTIFKTLLKLNR